MKLIFASFLIVIFVFQAEAMNLKPQSLSEALDPADNATLSSPLTALMNQRLWKTLIWLQTIRPILNKLHI
jgi:hypothetical protein